MLNESVKPANVLTEEELKQLEDKFSFSSGYGKAHYPMVEKMVASHRTLNSRNAKLVHENDELMAENEKLRKTIDHQHILLDKYESMLSEVNYE